MTGAGIDKSYLKMAATLNTEAISSPMSMGIAHSEASLVSSASQTYPAAMSRVTTHDLDQQLGAQEMPVAVFGTVALAATEGGALAASASEAMVLAYDEGTPATSRGSTRAIFEPRPVAKGVGKQHKVQVRSIGITNNPSGAFGISDEGDGPHAIAQGGEAVASAYSSKDHDYVLQAKKAW